MKDSEKLSRELDEIVSEGCKATGMTRGDFATSHGFTRASLYNAIKDPRKFSLAAIRRISATAGIARDRLDEIERLWFSARIEAGNFGPCWGIIRRLIAEYVPKDRADDAFRSCVNLYAEKLRDGRNS